MKAAIIVGGGPAGCQCALWLHMLGYEVIIVEKSDRLGGLQCESPYINNWLVGTMNLSGQQVAKNIHSHILDMKIPVIFNSTVDSIKKITGGFEMKIGNELLKTHSIVVETGVKPKAGSFTKSENVIIGPGKEIYNFSFMNKRVAIFGGGDNAAENYLFIREKKPTNCHIYARSIRARTNLWKNINPSDVFIGKYDADQRSMTVKVNSEIHTYDIFVVLYGWEANIPPFLEPFKNDLLDENHFIHSDNHRRTKINNLFSIGEVTNQTHPSVSTSIADGVIAAKEIQYQLKKVS